MASYNKCIFIGNLTRDVQLSLLPSGDAVAELGLAVNDKWTDKQGQKRETVCFIDCRAFGKRGETLAQYLRKGSPVLLEGKLELDQWEDKDGNKRSKHRLNIQGFQFLGGDKQEQGAQPPGPQPPAAQTAPGWMPQPPPDAPAGPQGQDIPF